MDPKRRRRCRTVDVLGLEVGLITGRGEGGRGAHRRMARGNQHLGRMAPNLRGWHTARERERERETRRKNCILQIANCVGNWSVKYVVVMPRLRGVGVVAVVGHALRRAGGPVQPVVSAVPVEPVVRSPARRHSAGR